MFGYIKLDSKCPRIMNAVFKKNYCMLCKAIEKNYGQLPRFALSFDVTFMLMLFTDYNFLEDIKKVRCLTSTDEVKHKAKEETIKKCAALNIAMAEAELLDHINDDKSFIAKLLLALFKGKFKKVDKDYPKMRKRLIDGYAKFDEYETNGKSLVEIENMFADMITDIAKYDFNIKDEQIINQLSYVAKWLYFIDACDDLDKDVKTKSFNPLREFKSKHDLFNNHYSFISQHLDEIRGNCIPIKNDDLNKKITNRVIFFGLPESMTKVMMERK